MDVVSRPVVRRRRAAPSRGLRTSGLTGSPSALYRKTWLGRWPARQSSTRWRPPGRSSGARRGRVMATLDVPDDWGLEGKVAIVTGGGATGTGIGNGRAAAILLAKAGARVVVVDRAPKMAEQTVTMIEAV